MGAKTSHQRRGGTGKESLCRKRRSGRAGDGGADRGGEEKSAAAGRCGHFAASLCHILTASPPIASRMKVLLATRMGVRASAEPSHATAAAPRETLERPAVQRVRLRQPAAPRVRRKKLAVSRAKLKQPAAPREKLERPTSGLSRGKQPRLELSDEQLDIVFEQLPNRGLLNAAATCRRYWQAGVAERLWRPRLEALLAGKHFVSARVYGQKTSLRAYYAAVRDARRTKITREEIASLDYYCFRFKKGAGPGQGWAAQDPWWNGRPAIRLKLCSDGAVVSLADAEPFWGPAGHRTGTWYHRFEDIVNGDALVSMNGHPSYHVRRHPVHWGVYLQSCWCVLSGFPMEAKGVDPHMEDEALDVTCENPRQRREVEIYNEMMVSSAVHVQPVPGSAARWL